MEKFDEEAYSQEIEEYYAQFAPSKCSFPIREELVTLRTLSKEEFSDYAWKFLKRFKYFQPTGKETLEDVRTLLNDEGNWSSEIFYPEINEKGEVEIILLTEELKDDLICFPLMLEESDMPIVATTAEGVFDEVDGLHYATADKVCWKEGVPKIFYMRKMDYEELGVRIKCSYDAANDDRSYTRGGYSI